MPVLQEETDNKWKRVHNGEIRGLQVRKIPRKPFITGNVLKKCIYLHLAYLFAF